jgi:predicted permease
VHKPVSANLSGAGEPQRLDGLAVSAEVLGVLGVRPALGRIFTAGEDLAGATPAVVLSDRLWRNAFGADPSIVGRTIVLDDLAREVVGVMPPDFGYPSRRVQFWIPLVMTPPMFIDRTNTFLRGIGRLRDGVTLDEARAELDVITARSRAQFPKENEQVSAAVNLLQADATSRQSRLMLLALGAAAVCVLLIVCANLANLMLARALGRRHELAVRTALGAGRERLVRQLATESLVLAVIGGTGGVLLARMMVPLLWQMVPASLPTAAAPGIDLRVLAFAAGLTIAVAVSFGLAPMFRAGDDIADLRDGARTTGGRRERLRGALVAAEIMASIVLLVVTGLLVRALWNIQQTNPGFRADNVLTVRTTLPLPKYAVTARRFAFYDRVLGGIQALPGVERAAYISFLPMVMRGGLWQVTIDGAATGRFDEQTVSVRFVTPGFFQTMGIPLRGRDISDSDVMTSEPVAVVSESFARRYWPNQDSIGRRFNVTLSDRTVVGVAGDIRVRGLESESEPQVYLAYRQVEDNWFPYYIPKDLVVRATTPLEQLVPAVRQIINAADPQQPLSDVRPMTAIVEGETASRSLQARVLAGFALVAFLLAAIGIHGVLSFAVSQRTPEIGVRIALGAQRRDVLGMVMKQGLALAAAGLLPGLALAYAAARSLQSMLIGVTPGDTLTFASAIALTVVMTLIGTLLPTVRAVRIDPLRAIRAE